MINDETITPAETLSAADLYYYDDPSVPATDTVEKHLYALEQHITKYIQTIT